MENNAIILGERYVSQILHFFGARIRRSHTQTNWNFSHFSHGVSEIVERGKRTYDLFQPRETIYTGLARRYASADRLLCDICFALVLTRESATMRAVAMFHPLPWILSQGNPVPGTRNVCRTLLGDHTYTQSNVT